MVDKQRASAAARELRDLISEMKERHRRDEDELLSRQRKERYAVADEPWRLDGIIDHHKWERDMMDIQHRWEINNAGQPSAASRRAAR